MLIQQNRHVQIFYANYEDIKNILMEHQEEDRTAHVQHETLQMLVSFLTPFKEDSLQVEAHTYAPWEQLDVADHTTGSRNGRRVSSLALHSAL
jgi:hypothetical protein